MVKALVIKELRESAGIAVLAVLAVVYALSELTAFNLFPWQNRALYAYPFVWDTLHYNIAVWIGAMAIALGFRQTAWEIGQGTFYFLLHQPTSRKQVFASKLAVGVTLVLVVSAALILAYLWWTVTLGHVGAPFEWSQTMSAWKVWVAMPVIYFGAFLSGIRPARWFGTRLIPLVTAIVVTAAAANMPWFWLTVLVTLVASGVFMVSIFYYVRGRDY